MYKIMLDGVLLGYTEKLNYIKRAKNGCFVAADKADAQGLVYKSTPYSISGKPRLGGNPFVGVLEVDVDELTALIDAQAANLDYVMMMTDTAIPVVTEDATEEVSTDAQLEV